MNNKRFIYYYNKKTKLTEKGMLKTVGKCLYFFTNNPDFNGARPSDDFKEMEGFEYSWWFGSYVKNLSIFKNIKEFEKATGINFVLVGHKWEKSPYCNFKFYNEAKIKFKEIKL